jgi:3-hydroxyisobutyrate dehydrogenase-like beta-hydroxyacid dehydrogenase
MNPSPTIGLLYAGEMGASLATVLRARGLRIVSTVKDRSTATAQRCQTVGIELLSSIAEVVAASDVLFSLVPPGEAMRLAQIVGPILSAARPGIIYVDANSIGPELAIDIAEFIRGNGGDFVDGAIHGQAARFQTAATFYLSGKRADEIASLFGERGPRLRVLGSAPGAASLMKMLLGGMSKGLCALFLEMATLAQRRGAADELMAEASHFYPGVMEAVQRMLPTYPLHARRRAQEMTELEKTALASGQQSLIISAVRELIEQLAQIDFESATEPREWHAARVAQYACEKGLLARQSQ